MKRTDHCLPNFGTTDIDVLQLRDSSVAVSDRVVLHLSANKYQRNYKDLKRIKTHIYDIMARLY